MLEQIVELYRRSAEPRIEDGALFAKVNSPAGFEVLMELLAKSWEQYGIGRVDRLKIDGREYLENEQLPKNGSVAEFKIELDASSTSRFYEDIWDMVKGARNELCRGQLPKEYFLWRDNLYSKDPGFEHPVEISKLVSFINGLEKLSHHQDQRSFGVFKLLFVAPVEQTLKKSPIVVLPINLSREIVEQIRGLDLSHLEQLRDQEAGQDTHHAAKQDVFRTALAEHLRPITDESLRLSHLVAGWQKLIDEYQRDLATYLSGFSFHKARSEVAAAQLNIASQFASLSADIGTKALSVPVALVAILAFPDTELNIVTSSILIVGMFLASVIIFATIRTQERQFEQMCAGKDLTLKALSGDEESYPPDLIEAVQDMKRNLASDETRQKRILAALKWIAWGPLLAMVIYVVYSLPPVNDTDTEPEAHTENPPAQQQNTLPAVEADSDTSEQVPASDVGVEEVDENNVEVAPSQQQD